MAPDKQEPNSKRKHTDQSLRAERDKVDEALEEKLEALNDTADLLIAQARSRADRVLAAARAKTDRQASFPAPSATVEKERAREDKVVEKERASADETMREERAEHEALLSLERDETDKDLHTERTLADGALATRDEFLGIVTHDLRNMLNAVVGFATLIETAVSGEHHLERVLTNIKRIRRSVAHMDRVIGDLIDVTSIEAGVLAVTPQEADPAQVVTEAVDTFQALASARDISLVAEIVPPPQLAVFDFPRILQVLGNLLGNALKFTAAGGKVVVRVERVSDVLQFAVSDTGIGVPSDKLEAVFERFLQVGKDDRRGVGLGLYIARSIVQGHGGRIWATSEFGVGSTFLFTLPIPQVTEGRENTPV